MADESTTTAPPASVSGKTQQELDDEKRADDEARARQRPENDPRTQALDAIAAANEVRIEEQLAAEGLSSRTPVGEVDPASSSSGAGDGGEHPGEGGEHPGDHPTVTPARRARAPAVDPQLLAQLGTEPLPMEALDGLRVRFKVAGKERVMTLQELRREAQLDGAAQTRLEEATTLLRQAQEATARLPAATPAAPGQPPVGVERQPAPGDSGTASQDVTAIAKNLVQSLFVGDEEAATATVVQLLARQNAPMDPTAIALRLVPAVRQQLSQEEAEAQFRSDFKDIVADPHLVTAADTFYAQVVQQDPQKPYAEALAEAGTMTRDWIAKVSGVKPATGPGTGSTRAEKLQAKERIDNVRALSRTEGSHDEPIQTASQVIAEMRKARGLE